MLLVIKIHVDYLYTRRPPSFEFQSVCDYEGQNTGCFTLKPPHLQIMCLGYITIYYNVVAKASSVFSLEKSYHNVF